MALRAFVAVDLSEPVGARVDDAIGPARRLAPRARWGSGSTHLTVIFLGAIDEALVPAIAESVTRVAARHAPIALRIAGAGTFGPRPRPRVLWLGASGDAARLVTLHADLARALAPHGVEREARAYHPHLTLARARDPRGDAGLAAARSALDGIDLGEVAVAEVTLFRSELSPKGARHSVLARSPFGA